MDLFFISDSKNEAFRWLCSGHYRGTVQIIHGMMEHSARYAEFAHALNTEGFHVYAHNLPGHGSRALEKNQLGHLPANGWLQMVDSVHSLFRYIQSTSSQPIFLFGHSMGSFLAQHVCALFQPKIHGMILSGTSYVSPFVSFFGKGFAKLGKLLKGESQKAVLLHYLIFSGYTRRIRHVKTLFDWLSRDENRVQTYLHDPLCGQIGSFSFFYEFFSGLETLYSEKTMEHFPKDIPIYCISGTECPVGHYTQGVKALTRHYQKHGARDISSRFYEGGRHELINEINRKEIYQDVIEWVTRHL